MDGGRRLLRSIKEAGAGLWPALGALRLALAGAATLASPSVAPRARISRPRSPRRTRQARLLAIASAGPTGFVLAGLFLGASFVYASVRGGQFDAFLAEHGAFGDIIARNIGFDIAAITIAGSRDLYETEIVQAAGVTAKHSLVFLNVADMRQRLMSVPLVREASVRKLYPDRLLIEIVERDPFAIWQKDGALVVVAVDGTPIEEVRDQRFADLPFVVGKGANTRIAEYQKIVEAGGNIGARAGIYVGERRWNIKLMNGLEVKLPEKQPEVAFAQFAKIARENRLLDKELIYVDLRVPGRMFARLSEEAATQRAESLAARKKGRPGQT